VNGPRSGLASARAARRGGALPASLAPRDQRRTDAGSVKRPIAVLSPTGRLVLAALVIGLFLGLVFTAAMPLWAGQPPVPPVAGAPPVPGIGWPGALLALGFVLAMVVPFRPYCQALALAGGPLRSGAAVVWLTAGLALVALAMYPRYGSDVFDYLGFERTWVVYGDNPLLGVPAAHPQDWSTSFVWFRDQPPAYGPLWAALTWPLVWLAGDSALRAVLGYKLLALVGYVGCCGLVWLSVEPARRPRALVLFGWSPLVLFEVLGKAHNDVLVALATLGAVWLLVGHRAPTLPVGDRAPRLPVGHQAPWSPVGRRGGPAWASLPLVMLGGLVKLSALAVLPVLVVALGRRWPRWQVVLGALAAASLVVAAYAPFWAGPATLQPIWHQTGRLVWSPATLLVLLLGAEQATLVRLLAGLVWLLALLGLLAWTRRAPPRAIGSPAAGQPTPSVRVVDGTGQQATPSADGTGRAARHVAPSMNVVDPAKRRIAPGMDVNGGTHRRVGPRVNGHHPAGPRVVPSLNVLGAAGWSVVLSVLLLSTAVYAHYLVPVVALAAVADDARLERAVLWLSIGALAAYGTEVLGVAIGSDWLGSSGYRLVGSLLLLGPALAALLGPALWKRLRSIQARPD